MGVQEGTKKMPTGLFSTWSAGVKTQRGAWAYNFSKLELTANMKKTITFFNTELKAYQETAEKQLPGKPSNRTNPASRGQNSYILESNGTKNQFQ